MARYYKSLRPPIRSPLRPRRPPGPRLLMMLPHALLVTFALAALLGAAAWTSPTSAAHALSALRGAASGAGPTTVVSVLPPVDGGAEAFSTVPTPEPADAFAFVTAPTQTTPVCDKTKGTCACDACCNEYLFCYLCCIW